MTQWKVGIERGGGGGGDNPQSVNLQIWTPVMAGEYSLANEVTYTKMDDETIASVLASMSVMARDLLGFYVPGGRLQPHTLPDVGLTMYTTDGSFTSSLSELQTTVGPSPYISVVFSGENNCTFVQAFFSCITIYINTWCCAYYFMHAKGLLSFAPKVACSHIQSRFVLPVGRSQWVGSFSKYRL